MYRYSPNRSYDWNYEHAPDERAFEGLSPLDAPVPGRDWDFCGLPVSSPLGAPAGPLLNGRWVLRYANAGFDVLTYKTVRSRARECYPLPNLQPVSASDLSGHEAETPASWAMTGSWAVSFGMPSRDPEVWRRDVEWTRARLPEAKLLSVSVVGTMQPGWSLDDLAADYAQCARWAVESGAHCVEANLSCPNVASEDGQLYQQPEHAALVARAVREAAGSTPVLLKIGHVTRAQEAEALTAAVAPHADALSMVNCLATLIRGADGELMFNGQPRGIGGAAIRDASLRQVGLFHQVIRERQLPLKLVGVGGISSAADVRMHLEAGAHAVHLATAAMRNPDLGREIRQELSKQPRRRRSDALGDSAATGIWKDV
ncbi:MAG: HisA/HisF-related TIM barrel protein [Actinomycetota bacterium]